MVNNIQPRLSKIGKSLSFQNNKSISSGDNGFVLTNNDGTAANLSTGGVNCKSNAISSLLWSDTNSRVSLNGTLLVGDNILRLNVPYKDSDVTYRDAGIQAVDSLTIYEDVVITGINTESISLTFNSADCRLLHRIQVTTDFAYVIDLSTCTDLDDFIKALSNNALFSKNFIVEKQNNTVIISSDSIITSCAVFSYAGSYFTYSNINGGWQIDNGLIIKPTGLASTEGITVEGMVYTEENYYPDKKTSLINKEYADLNYSSFNSANMSITKRGVSIFGGGIQVIFPEISIQNKDFSLISPFICCGINSQVTILSLENEGSVFSLNLINGTIVLQYKDKQLFSVSLLNSDIITTNFSIVYESDTKQLTLYEGRTSIYNLSGIDFDLIFNSLKVCVNNESTNEVMVSGECALFNYAIDRTQLLIKLTSSNIVSYHELGASFLPITSGTLFRGRLYSLSYSEGDFSSCGMNNVTGQQWCTTTASPVWGNSSVSYNGAVLDLLIDKFFANSGIIEISNNYNIQLNGIVNFNDRCPEVKYIPYP